MKDELAAIACMIVAVNQPRFGDVGLAWAFLLSGIVLIVAGLAS